MKYAIKYLGLVAMALGVAAILIGWLLDPTFSLNNEVRLISIEQEFLQTDFFLWGTILFAAGFNGYSLHTDL